MKKKYFKFNNMIFFLYKNENNKFIYSLNNTYRHINKPLVNGIFLLVDYLQFIPIVKFFYLNLLILIFSTHFVTECFVCCSI